MLQLSRDWADARSRCWRRGKGDEQNWGNDASAWWARHQHDASSDASATRASTPVQRGQGQAQFWAVSSLWSTSSDCRGLGWAGRRHETPSGQQPFQHQPLPLNPSEQHVGCGNRRRGGCGHGGQEKARGKGHKRPQDWKKAQGVEVITILINHKMAEFAEVNAKREGWRRCGWECSPTTLVA